MARDRRVRSGASSSTISKVASTPAGRAAGGWAELWSAVDMSYQMSRTTPRIKLFERFQGIIHRIVVANASARRILPQPGRPAYVDPGGAVAAVGEARTEEHTTELQSAM